MSSGILNILEEADYYNTNLIINFNYFINHQFKGQINY